MWLFYLWQTAGKFPDVIHQTLSVDGKLPGQAVHKSVEAAKDLCRHVRLHQTGSGSDTRHAIRDELPNGSA
jgi:hypothetical protein